MKLRNKFSVGCRANYKCVTSENTVILRNPFGGRIRIGCPDKVRVLVQQKDLVTRTGNRQSLWILKVRGHRQVLITIGDGASDILTVLGQVD